jgi:putative quorum-sensing-regulated virulence factor
MNMPFGKYKGHTLSEIPEDYLCWILDNLLDLRPTLRRAIGNELAWREESSRYGQRGHYSYDHASSAHPSSGLLVGETDRPMMRDLIERGYRALAARLHPDLGGDTRAMQHLNALIEKLRKGLT